jgi:ribonuclease D
VLHGWRRVVFGEAALALKGGKVALGVEGRKVRVIEAAG